MFLWLIHNSLSTSIVLLYSLIRLNSILYCKTDFLLVRLSLHFLYISKVLWLYEPQNKFVDELFNAQFVFVSSLWQTIGKWFLLSKNTVATIRWIEQFNLFHKKFKTTLEYHHLFIQGDSINALLTHLQYKLLTLPKLLTWYDHSHQGMSFQISCIKKILFLLSKLKPRMA